MYRVLCCDDTRRKEAGVSGDSSCADHNIGWRTRAALHLDDVPAGVSGDAAHPDNIVYDITPQEGQQEGVSKSGWGFCRKVFA